MYELTFEQFVDQRHWLAALVSWTYWNSEFTVVGLALLWVYIRRHEQLHQVPQLDPAREPARADRLRLHADGAAAAARRRVREQPHRRGRPARGQPVRGDAEPARLRLADRRRSCSRASSQHWWAKAFWIAWPAWVWFAVMATGNHFWLDCLAGVGVALIAMTIVYKWGTIRSGLFSRVLGAQPAAHDLTRCYGPIT